MLYHSCCGPHNQQSRWQGHEWPVGGSNGSSTCHQGVKCTVVKQGLAITSLKPMLVSSSLAAKKDCVDLESFLGFDSDSSW